MTNNKQSMKLYTEEQIKEAFNCGRLYLGREGDTNFYHLIDKLTPIELPSDSLCINCDESKSTHNVCMDCMIKIGKENIELPSDEEIDDHVEEDFLNATEVHKYSEEVQLLMKAMCKAGMKCMRDKIKGDNK